jgi:hypothetical protein
MGPEHLTHAHVESSVPLAPQRHRVVLERKDAFVGRFSVIVAGLSRPRTWLEETGLGNELLAD